MVRAIRNISFLCSFQICDLSNCLIITFSSCLTDFFLRQFCDGYTCSVRPKRISREQQVSLLQHSVSCARTSPFVKTNALFDFKISVLKTISNNSCAEGRKHNLENSHCSYVGAAIIVVSVDTLGEKVSTSLSWLWC